MRDQSGLEGISVLDGGDDDTGPLDRHVETSARCGYQAALLSVPLWHAPALVHWGGQSTAKALFSSTVACWRNRSAFLVYGAVGAGGLLLVSSGVALLFRLIGLGPMEVVGLFATVLVFFMIFYASLYFTFVDCFEAPGPNPSPEIPTPGSTP